MSTSVLAESNDSAPSIGDRHLKSEGHSVAVTSERDEVMRLVREQQPEVIILNSHFPGDSVLDLYHQIKVDPTLQGARIILLDRVTDSTPATEADPAVSDGLLRKPLNASQFLIRVDTLIEEMKEAISIAADGTVGEASPSAVNLGAGPLPA